MGLFDKMKDRAQNVITTQTDNLKSKNIAGKNIGELIKPIENKAIDLKSQFELDRSEDHITLELALTDKIINTVKNDGLDISVRKDKFGEFYFSKHFNVNSERFRLIDLDINYPKYTSSKVTKTTGTTKQQGRMGSAAAGAFLGGTSGALIGASRGKKSTIDLTTTTETKVKGPLMNTKTTAKLIFHSTETQKDKIIKVIIDDSKNKKFNDMFLHSVTKITRNQEVASSQNTSPIQEVKELKELLDMGILSREEFEAKKKELLNL